MPAINSPRKDFSSLSGEMYPAISIGPLTLYTIGPILAAGFVTGSFIAWRKLVENRFDEEESIGLLLWATLSGFVFSRIAYILIHFSDFGFSPLRWLFFTRYAGFSFWGALGGVILAGWYFAKSRNWNFFALADAVVFGGLTFQIFATLGCFFDGCFLGKPTNLPLGLPFVGQVGRLHPVQLYELFGLLLLLFFLARIELRWRTFSWYKSQAPGFLFFSWGIFYFLARVLTGFFRQGDLYWFGLTGDQLASLGVLIVSGVALYFRSGRNWRADLSLAKRGKFPVR